MYPVLGLILFDFKKLTAADDLIPKFKPSVTSFENEIKDLGLTFAFKS